MLNFYMVTVKFHGLPKKLTLILVSVLPVYLFTGIFEQEPEEVVALASDLVLKLLSFLESHRHSEIF